MKNVGNVLKFGSKKKFGVFLISFGKRDDLCVVKEMFLELIFHGFEKLFSLMFEHGDKFLVA